MRPPGRSKRKTALFPLGRQGRFFAGSAGEGIVGAEQALVFTGKETFGQGGSQGQGGPVLFVRSQFQGQGREVLQHAVQLLLHPPGHKDARSVR